MHEELKKFSSGATSTKGPRLELLPHYGLICAADRFELGLIKHPDGCYNNLTNQKPLKDKDWLIERASHAINHLLNIIENLRDDKLEDSYGDAGAVAFCGLVIGEAIHANKIPEG